MLEITTIPLQIESLPLVTSRVGYLPIQQLLLEFRPECLSNICPAQQTKLSISKVSIFCVYFNFLLSKYLWCILVLYF